MSCVTQVLLIDILDAAWELNGLGFDVPEDITEDIAQERGNGGVFGDWADEISEDRKSELDSFSRNPTDFDEFSYLVKKLLLTDEQSESALPIRWRISW